MEVTEATDGHNITCTHTHTHTLECIHTIVTAMHICSGYRVVSRARPSHEKRSSCEDGLAGKTTRSKVQVTRLVLRERLIV